MASISIEPSNNNNNNNNNLQPQRSSLIDFEAFGTPKRTNERLKKLKGQLQLYTALDSLEFQTQDRRFWRRPNTFSIGHADRKSQFGGGGGGGADGGGGGLQRIDGNDDPLGVGMSRPNTSGRNNKNNFSTAQNQPHLFEAGPRGILQALSHATSSSTTTTNQNQRNGASSASPVPFPPTTSSNGNEIYNEHPNHASNLYQQQQHRASITIRSIEEEKAANEQAAHISELELRKVRKEYRELVAKQRADEEAVMIPMFEAERQAEEARSQKSKISSAGQDDDDNNKNKKTKPVNTGVVELFGHRFSVNDNVNNNNNTARSHHQPSTPRNRPNATSSATAISTPRHRISTADASLSARRPTQQNEEAKTTTGQATSLQFIPAPPPTAPTNSSARGVTSTPDHLYASRVRVLQFNAYRSNGISGISKPNTGAHRIRSSSSSLAHQHETQQQQQQQQQKPSFTASDFFGNKKREFRSIQEVEEAEEEETLMRKRREEEMLCQSPKTAYSMSSHPALRRDTVSKMYAVTQEADAEIEEAEKQMKQNEKNILDSKILFSKDFNSNNINNNNLHKKKSSNVNNNNNNIDDGNNQFQTEDPTIEVNDPFAFLDEGKFQSLAANEAAASTKKNYNLTLQEKILSLAAMRAGVSLSAAAAPARLLGMRQPTAEAEHAHEISLEEIDRLERKKALAAASKNQSARRNRQMPQDQQQQHQQHQANSRQVGNGAGSLQGVNTNKNNKINVTAGTGTTTNPVNGDQQQQQQCRDADEVREGVMRRQHEFKLELERRRNAVKTGKYCREAPLPFGQAGPNEKHIPSPRIHPPAANSGRQERNLCDNVHLSSRTPGACAYRPSPQQFVIPTWKKISSLRGFANAGLAPSVTSW